MGSIKGHLEFVIIIFWLHWAAQVRYGEDRELDLIRVEENESQGECIKVNTINEKII